MTASNAAPRDQLERAVDVVVADYARFIAGGSPDAAGDPKGFATWHSSGRTALGHLEFLMKLVRTAGGQVTDEAADLLAQASRGMGAPEDEEHEGDDAA